MKLVKGNNRLCRAGKVLRKKFWSQQNAAYIGGKNTPDYRLYESQLGFDRDAAFHVACEFDQKTIFQEMAVRMGLNVVFYWVDDNNMYVIFNETTPSQIRKIPVKVHKRGLSIEDKYGDLDSHNEGEVVATFYRDRSTKNSLVWNTLKINGVPIREVLKRSVILGY